MGSRKSIIREAIERLDSLMAIGQSRFQAKQARRATSPEEGWTVSTGKIHSHTTRKVYQQHVLAFINWARTNRGIMRLAWLDERADELVTHYLVAHVAAEKSAYTLQTERAALRLFFGNWSLAATVRIPTRTRSTTGDGTLFVHVKKGKGGKAREVPVLFGHEEDVLVVVRGRAPDDKVFDRIPGHMDVHSYRRDSAQRRYLQHAPGQVLPPLEGRLGCDDYDPVAVQRVSWALGHNRRDVVLRHYLR